MSYITVHSKGILVHGSGLSDITGKGLLFAGKSGVGKTTISRLWSDYSKAMILNDDRIVVRTVKDRFFMYGAPWGGDFPIHFRKKIMPAPLSHIFFIHHASRNAVGILSQTDAFSRFYQALFPVFWNKYSLGNAVSFMRRIIGVIPTYDLGFVNNKEVIPFVRKIRV